MGIYSFFPSRQTHLLYAGSVKRVSTCLVSVFLSVCLCRRSYTQSDLSFIRGSTDSASVYVSAPCTTTVAFVSVVFYCRFSDHFSVQVQHSVVSPVCLCVCTITCGHCLSCWFTLTLPSSNLKVKVIGKVMTRIDWRMNVKLGKLVASAKTDLNWK